MRYKAIADYTDMVALGSTMEEAALNLARRTIHARCKVRETIPGNFAVSLDNVFSTRIITVAPFRPTDPIPKNIPEEELKPDRKVTRHAVACECEEMEHESQCPGDATHTRHTMYGRFKVCDKCWIAKHMTYRPKGAAPM